jgi:pimeloyl-ACP methyl ester carboxylesterase
MMGFATLVIGLLVALAAAGALSTLWLTRRAERRFPPTGTYVSVRGIRLHYLDLGPTALQPSLPSGGAALPIVLLHGAFSALQDYSATILPELAKSHRVLAFDRPGQGYSGRDATTMGTPQGQADTIREALAALDVSRAVMVGFSYGGAVALAHAVRHREATAALILLAAPTHPWPGPIDTEYFVPTWPVLGPLLLHTLVMPLGTMLTSRGTAAAFYPLPIASGFAASPVPLALRPGSYAANAQDIRELKPALREMSSDYGTLRLPITIVHGAEDHTVGLKTHSDKLKAQLPAVDLIPLPGAGHQLLYTHPAVVLDAIERTVAKAKST